MGGMRRMTAQRLPADGAMATSIEPPGGGVPLSKITACSLYFPELLQRSETLASKS
jgi:hypothetical protein